MSDAGPRPLAGAPWLAAPESHTVVGALGGGGRAARFVGGCVRDGLVDPARDVVDLDVATAEPPERATALLEAAGLKVLPTGLAHGTVTAIAGARRFEVTTLRRDVATDGRRAVVAFTDDFEADAARRDLTINALSCDLTGRVWDPFGGREDLSAGRIRFVGDPYVRIREDYLRILRFFRFFARFGAPPADEAALTACRDLRGGVERLSGERLQAETFKLLVAPRAEEALALMAEVGVLPLVVPPGRRPAGSLASVGSLPEDPVLRLAALLRRGEAGAAEVEHVAGRLRLARRDGERLLRLVTGDPPDVAAPPRRHRADAARLGPALYRDRLRLAAASNAVDPAPALAALEGWAPPPFPLSGADLVGLGMSPGPRLGRALEALRERWIESDFTLDREALLGLARAAAEPPLP